MEVFSEVFGAVGAVCLGIIILTVFFQVLGFFKRRVRGFEVVKLKGFVKDGKLVNVHMRGDKPLLRVRFVGFTDHDANRIPHQLARMLVLKSESGDRMFVRADRVAMIEEIDAE